MSIKTYRKGEQKQLSKNFKLSEFHCHCKRDNCETTKIDDELIDRLQWIREQTGRSITVNSGFRCNAHNLSSAVGGSKTSKHPMGKAADIVIKGMTAKEMARWAVKAGFRGVIRYSNRVHVDTRDIASFYYRDKTTYGYTTVKPARWGAKVICNPWKEPTEAKRQGDKGLDVRWVQWAVAKSGIVCGVDGSYGALTVAAVKKFQKMRGLEVDGIAGPKTQAKLKEVTAQ